MTTTTAPPDLNTAADALIAALEDVHDLPEFRHGLRKSIGHWSLLAAYTDPAQRGDADELIATWRALDDLAAAVAARKEA